MSGIGKSVSIKSSYTEDRYATESNDCSVRAIKHALDIPYEQAHNMMAALGRKNRHGIITAVYENFLDNHEKFQKIETRFAKRGYDKYTGMRTWLEKDMTAGRIIDANKDKKMILCVRGHTYFVDRGTVVDFGLKLKTRVRGAWIVKE